MEGGWEWSHLYWIQFCCPPRIHFYLGPQDVAFVRKRRFADIIRIQWPVFRGEEKGKQIQRKRQQEDGGRCWSDGRQECVSRTSLLPEILTSSEPRKVPTLGSLICPHYTVPTSCLCIPRKGSNNPQPLHLPANKYVTYMMTEVITRCSPLEEFIKRQGKYSRSILSYMILIPYY